ncbi:MAG: hypothetical protein K2N74_04820, partial [Clostridiales bacterium]|nr:hypothetical protein [Clostridiales bacterium]
PLFSMPDCVSCVVAAGRKKTLFAARYFAEVRGVPCAVFPSDGALFGAYEPQTELLCGGITTTSALRTSEIYCDAAIIKKCAGAYAALLLSRLALLEARVLRSFRISCGNAQAEERMFSLFSQLPAEPNEEDVVRWNAEMRRAEREGAYIGEGTVLADLLRAEGVSAPEWCAYTQLSALYFIFFTRGKPRKYFIPNYAARSVVAGTEYPAQNIPTEAEFASRSVALEAMRAQFAAETASIVKRKTAYNRTFLALGGCPQSAGLSTLKKLPEVTSGLTAIIRDFGLMDW